MMSKQSCQHQPERGAPVSTAPVSTAPVSAAPGSASVSLAASARRVARPRHDAIPFSLANSRPRLVRLAALAQQARRLRSQGCALWQVCVITLCLLAMVAATRAQDVQPLPPNTLIERELTSTQPHVYRIALKAGQLVHFDVFQKSIDVMMSLIAPDGKPILTISGTTFGVPDTLSAIATVKGIYQLRIQTASDPRISGQYQLKAEVKDAATPNDKKRIQAERLMVEYRQQTQVQKQLEIAQQARALWAEIGERFWEGYVLTFVSASYRELKEKEKALTALEEALAIMREVKSRAGESIILENLGVFYDTEGQREKAIPYYEQSANLATEVGDYSRAKQNLLTLSSKQWSFGDLKGAEATNRKRLEVSRLAKSPLDEINALIILSLIVGRDAGQYSQGIEFLEAGLLRAREIKDKGLESNVLSYLSELNLWSGASGKIEKALEYANAAIALANEAGNTQREADLYERLLVSIYSRVGRIDKVQEAGEKALLLYRNADFRVGEANILLLLGNLYISRGDEVKGLECYEQSLKIYQELKNTPIRIQGLPGVIQPIQALGNLAEYYLSKNPAKALAYLEQSLESTKSPGYGGYARDIIRMMGIAYRNLKQYDKAIQYHERALQMGREFPGAQDRFPDIFAQMLVGLMLDWRDAGKPETAIYYGKLAINKYQEARSIKRQGSDQRELQTQLQKTFDKNVEKFYRDLADLLISQSRLPEAEQVLRMLKEEEYFEYIRGDNNNTPKGEKATLTPKEEAADKRYREVADKLAELGAERSSLLNKTSRTEAENKRLAQIESDLVVAGQAFQKFLDKLNDELKTTKDAGKVSQLREAQGLMEDLRELGNGAVALYTVVGEDTFSIVLTTADVQKAYQVPIKAAELNRKVLAFRAVLQNPTLDPLPLAQELYKTLLAPVEKDLRAAQAELLMWSLDGVLRYVPMAALHDGNKYLVETYRHAVFTPASNARLHLTPSKNWRALGLGVTKAHGEGVPALPGVAEEMRGIIKADGSDSGVLPGTIKLDEQFTQESMLTGLRERNNVVHIASHFQFQPGNETNSALLLGDGNLLSLAQIKALPNIFSGVELLTLSACNTATSGSGANGKEIEGFGVLAQRQGARAVVASLWPVADRSTMRLMQEFYAMRESGLSKAEAIRQAQGRMLRGELAVTKSSAARSIVHEEDKTAGLPRFKADAQKPFAHPYYWAPFILIGNWK